MREVIATGKNVEEATENGCRELGLSRDEVSVEILEMPVKKLFKTSPASVKVTADEGDDAPAMVKEEAVAQQAKPNAAPSAPQEAQYKPLVTPAPQNNKAPLLPEEPEEAINLDENPRAALAANYLMSILSAMGAGEARICAVRQGDATLFRVEGDIILEKMDVRGEVIQALSYLMDRAVNAGVEKKDEDYLRIRLDVAGYRNRRESELVSLAQRTGKEVARTGRSRTLAPMNPYERLIVHTAISNMEGVISESVGADVERRVVIKSTGPNATDGDSNWRSPQKGGRSSGGRPNRSGQGGGRSSSPRSGGRDQGAQRGGYSQNKGARPYSDAPQTSTPQREYANKEHDPSTAPVVPNQREAISDGDDLPLYGKIDL